MVFGQPRAAQRNSGDLLLIGEREKLGEAMRRTQLDGSVCALRDGSTSYRYAVARSVDGVCEPRRRCCSCFSRSPC